MPQTQVTDTNNNGVEHQNDTAANFETHTLAVAAITPEMIEEFVAQHGERIWAVAASGHGSSYTFGPGVLIPDESAFKTLTEAKEEADHWSGISDTIGGSALVVHMPTYLQRIIDFNGEHPLHGPHRGYTEDILRTVERKHSKI